MAHTPTPWSEFGMVIGSYGYRAICRMVDGETTEAKPIELTSRNWEQAVTDEKFILRAVNCHEELLAALTGILDQACTNGCPEYTGENTVTVQHTDACISARAAIAKATT